MLRPLRHAHRHLTASASKVKTNFVSLSKDKLNAKVLECGLPAFRAKQLMQWVYGRRVSDFSAMHNLDAKTRKQFDDEFYIDVGSLRKCEVDPDGTRKWLVGWDEGQRAVEMVFIPKNARGTLCISSQAGCSLNCAFCATGAMSKDSLRNLSSGEIVSQYLLASSSLGVDHRVTNLVFMGMGEPLYNWRNVRGALQILRDHVGLASRSMTVSTAGVAPLLEQVAAEGVRLAISLHAVDDDMRDILVPLNKTYNISTLLDACRRVAPRLSRRITFEYVLLGGVNDGRDKAVKLAQLVEGIDCVVNLIPFNAWDGSVYRPPETSVGFAFQEELLSRQVMCTIRLPRGRDIKAACGQLGGDK
mmetsp:Transcript_70630/g.166530  ORF Transcript_70630/g.166530 Transcript_70630/m.166530 type:complete len:359 (+) Transcript_70630:31-1107(+)